jgi:hypothetical protein
MLIKESQLRSIILSEIKRSYNHNSNTLNEGITLNKDMAVSAFLGILVLAGAISRDIMNNQEAKQKVEQTIEKELSKHEFYKASSKGKNQGGKQGDMYRGIEEVTKTIENLANSKELQNLTKDYKR